MELLGFWYHPYTGITPSYSLEDAPDSECVFITKHQHSELFSKAGAGYDIIFPIEIGKAPYLKKTTVNKFNIDAEKTRLRIDRDILLRMSDWTQLNDIPEKIKSPYKKYRQDLRDIPQQNSFPFDVEWPIEPNHTGDA